MRNFESKYKRNLADMFPSDENLEFAVIIHIEFSNEIFLLFPLQCHCMSVDFSDSPLLFFKCKQLLMMRCLQGTIISGETLIWDNRKERGS